MGIISATWKVSPDFNNSPFADLQRRRAQTKLNIGTQREAKVTSNMRFSRIAMALMNDITYM